MAGVVLGTLVRMSAGLGAVHLRRSRVLGGRTTSILLRRLFRRHFLCLVDGARELAETRLRLNGPKLRRSFAFFHHVKAEGKTAHQVEVGRNDVRVMEENRLVLVIAGSTLDKAVRSFPAGKLPLIFATAAAPTRGATGIGFRRGFPRFFG